MKLETVVLVNLHGDGNSVLKTDHIGIARVPRIRENHLVPSLQQRGQRDGNPWGTPCGDQDRAWGNPDTILLPVSITDGLPKLEQAHAVGISGLSFLQGPDRRFSDYLRRFEVRLSQLQVNDPLAFTLDLLRPLQDIHHEKGGHGLGFF